MTDPVILHLPWFTLYGQPDRPGRLARLRCAAAMLAHEAVELAAGSTAAHSMRSAAHYHIGVPPAVVVPASRRNNLYLTTVADGYPDMNGELVSGPNGPRVVELRVYASGTVGAANESITTPGALVEVRLSNPGTGQWEAIGSGGAVAGAIPVGVRADSWAMFNGILGGTAGGSTPGEWTAECAALADGIEVGALLWLTGDIEAAGFYRHLGAGSFTQVGVAQYLAAGNLTYVGQTIGVSADLGEAARTGGVPDGTTWVISSPDGTDPFARKQSIVPEELAAARIPAWVGESIPDGHVTQMVDGAPAWVAGYVAPHIPVGRRYDVTDPQFAGGAAGDGVTDDTDAIEAAFAAAALLPGEVFFPAVDVDAGEFYRVRRRSVVPSWTTATGQGLGSILKKDPTVSATVAGASLIGATSFTVDDASVFAVGDEVTISEPVGNFEWNSTHAVITDITGNDITIDRPAVSAYTNATVLTAFPLITNNIGHTNDPATATRGGRVQHLCLDQNFGGDDPTDLTFIDFTNSAIHWEHAFDYVVHDVHILNAAGDAYSDQYRGPDATPGYGYPTSNAIIGSHVHSSVRHGVHIGSDTASAQIVGNRITDCGWMAVFLCRNAQNTAITGNTFVNCRQGIGGSDVRQADDDAVTDLTPYGDIRGDIGTVVTGNTFLGGPLSDVVNTMPAIDLAAQGVAVGNTIMDWNGGIRVVTDAVDCTVSGNSITLAPNYSSNSGISVAAGAHRCAITGNTIRGGGHGAGPVTKQDTGIAVEDANSVSIIGNHLANLEGGIALAGDLNQLTMAHNTAIDVVDAYGLVRIYGTLTDSAIDVTAFDPAYNSISYHDGDGESAQVRLIINGLGDNGADDPATGGPWNGVTGERYTGVFVQWNDGSQHISQYQSGYGWLEFAADTPDLSVEHVLFDETRLTAGEFDLSGVDLTAYAVAGGTIRWEFSGRSDHVASAQDSLRMQWLGTNVAGSYYGNSSGALSTLWVLTSSIPSSQTNDDRTGVCEGKFHFKTNGWSVGSSETQGMASTGAVGVANNRISLFYSGTAATPEAVITGLNMYLNTGAPAAGTRLTIWGRIPA
jgi:hypothetical protein